MFRSRKNSYPDERANESDTGKTERTLKIFSPAMVEGVKANYLLMDNGST